MEKYTHLFEIANGTENIVTLLRNQGILHSKPLLMFNRRTLTTRLNQVEAIDYSAFPEPYKEQYKTVIVNAGLLAHVFTRFHEPEMVTKIEQHLVSKDFRKCHDSDAFCIRYRRELTDEEIEGSMGCPVSVKNGHIICYEERYLDTEVKDFAMTISRIFPAICFKYTIEDIRGIKFKDIMLINGQIL